MIDLKKPWLVETARIAASCVFVVLLLVGYDTWTRFYDARKPVQPPKPLVQNGSPISLGRVDFTKHPLSLILITAPTCKYCLASEHFHSSLLKIAQNANVPVFVTVPSIRHASQYMKQLAVSTDKVREYHQLSLSVSGTPTIIGVDNTAHVRALWTGLATPADESEIVAELHRGSFISPKGSTRIDAPDFQDRELSNLMARTPLTVIDTREREKADTADGVVNIPLQELPFRAPRELDKTKLQVVNCKNILWDECKSAVSTLKKLQFNTATLGAGTYHLRCKLTPITN